MLAKALRLLGRPGTNSQKTKLDLHLDRSTRAIEKHLGFTLVPEQLRCARALIDGYIVEMQTGEGKTAAVSP